MNPLNTRKKTETHGTRRFEPAILSFGNLAKSSSYNVAGGDDKAMREPLLAGILSLLVPGVGQIYNGRIIVGILWLVLTGVSWIGSAGLLGWVVHLISAWCAYSYAKDNPIRS